MCQNFIEIAAGIPLLLRSILIGFKVPCGSGTEAGETTSRLKSYLGTFPVNQVTQNILFVSRHADISQS